MTIVEQGRQLTQIRIDVFGEGDGATDEARAFMQGVATVYSRGESDIPGIKQRIIARRPPL
eukprot:6794597-Alexandrium_andersonii.AAC.1